MGELTMFREKVEDGERTVFVERLDTQGVRVVVTWDAGEDQRRVHVYVDGDRGEIKLDSFLFTGTIDEAANEGFARGWTALN